MRARVLGRHPQRDIRAVSTDPETFISGRAITLEDVPTAILETVSSVPGHGLPAPPAAAPVVLQRVHPTPGVPDRAQIAGQAKRIVDDLVQNPEGDLVAAVSRRLPMLTIFEMMGVDDDYRGEPRTASTG